MQQITFNSFNQCLELSLENQKLTIFQMQLDLQSIATANNHKLPSILLKNEFNKEKRFVPKSTEVLVELKN